MEPGKQQENNCKNRKIPELSISAQYPENGRMYRLRGCAAGFRVFRPATGAGLAGPFAGNLMVAWLSCQDELFQMSNWTGRPKVRRRGGMAQSVGHLGRNFKPKRGGMAQSVEHIVHIDGVVGSSPTVTTTNPVGVQVQRLPDFFACSSRVRTF